jgi:hypothetical protein
MERITHCCNTRRLTFPVVRRPFIQHNTAAAADLHFIMQTLKHQLHIAAVPTASPLQWHSFIKPHTTQRQHPPRPEPPASPTEYLATQHCANNTAYLSSGTASLYPT